MLSILLKTTFELIFAALLILGFIYEEKLIKFEHYVKMVIVVNYRRYKRRKQLDNIRKNRNFKLISGRKSVSKTACNGGFDVA